MYLSTITFRCFALRRDDWRVWVGALIAYDFFYYWNHRIDHEVGLFWAAHVVHHQSEAFNLSTALRQPSSGVLLGWIFYLPMAIAGVPPVVFVAVGLIDLLYQFWIHTELVGKLGWFDRVFASPSNHRVHHGVNDLYLDKNYGGILIVWDRLFGTYEDEVEPPVYGVRGGLSTFDPISANLSYYATMADLSWRATDWRDKIRVWFAPPGWVPANLRRPGPQAPYDLNAIRRYDPPAGRAATILVFAALVAMIGATAAFLMAGPSLPLANGVGVFLSLAASLWAMGSLLDGRISVLETLYVFAAALTCSAYALGWPGVESLAKPAAMALLIVSFAPRDGQADVKRLVTAALVASLAGDTLLLCALALRCRASLRFSLRTASTSRPFRAASAFCPRGCSGRHRRLRGFGLRLCLAGRRGRAEDPGRGLCGDGCVRWRRRPPAARRSCATARRSRSGSAAFSSCSPT